MAKKKLINDKEKNVIWLLLIAVITVVMWQTEIGRYILYPFTLLGTWFHEMGHGLMAVFLGGNFEKLEIYSNGSGLAVYSGGLFLGGFGSALVAAAGPIGPTLAGSFLIVSSRKSSLTKFMLWVLGLLLIISGIIWVRSAVGIAVIAGFGLLTIFFALKGKSNVQRFWVQFLGIQACLSVYLSIGYLFSTGAHVGGIGHPSDTAIMSEHLLLPHWFWATIILLFSILAIGYSLLTVYRK